MKNNLEKVIKGCFKRRVSMTLAALTVFAITGSMGYAKSYKLNEHLHSSWLNKELCDELNKTNVQVNSNTATIDAMSQDLLKTVKASKKIEEIKNRQQEEIAERVKGDLANSNAIKAEKKEREAAIKTVGDKADKANAAVAEETTARKEADRIHDAAIESNRSAISHLDKKVNKGTAMLVAMSNVDFQDVNAGEVAVGAGVGHYVGDQAVAIGVAYGVNDDFKVHAKFSGVAGNTHYNAIGGGLTYKFRTR